MGKKLLEHCGFIILDRLRRQEVIGLQSRVRDRKGERSGSNPHKRDADIISRTFSPIPLLRQQIGHDEIHNRSITGDQKPTT